MRGLQRGAGMSSRNPGVVLVLACLSLPAGAAEGPRLPAPPPAIKRVTAPAVNLALSLDTWQKDAARGACFAAEPTLASDVKSTVARIQNHQDAAERKAAADWWDGEMRPWLVAWTSGVPGVGSYEELARRRDESLAFLKANEPRRPATTDAEKLALAQKLVAYRQRALEDYAFLERLRAMSACFKSNRLADLDRPLGPFDGYENWHRLVDPLAIRRLDELRQEVLPPLNDDDARKTIALLDTLPPDAREKRAEAIDLGLAVLARLAEDEPRAAIVAAFAPTYDDPAQRAEVAATARRVQETRAALEQKLAAALRALTL